MESQERTKLKILYIITQGEGGGAQRYVFDLATRLSQNFEIVIAVGEQAGRLDLQNKIKKWNIEHGTLNIALMPLRFLVRPISPIHDILAMFELAKLYKTLKPDIIHLNSSKTGIIGSFARLMTYGLRPMIIYTVHGWVFNEPLGLIKKTLYRLLEKFTARWKDKIIVLSKQDFIGGKQIGIPEKKLIEIPLGIENPKFLKKGEARRFLDPRFHEDDTIVGTIANLYPTKGLDVLIEAVNEVVNVKGACPAVRPEASTAGVENVKFVIIGEGQEKKKLEGLIKKYRLEDSVFLTGFVENASRFLPAFDIFVLPSRKEGLPYTILEASAAGLPIIASAVGGLPSLALTNLNLQLVKPEDPKELAQKITALLVGADQPRPPAEMTRHVPIEYSLKPMIEKTLIIYHSLISGSVKNQINNSLRLT